MRSYFSALRSPIFGLQESRALVVVETSIRRSVCATVQTMDAQLGLRMNLLSFDISSLSIIFQEF